MRFEILLDNNLSSADKARMVIEKEFKTHRYTPRKDYPEFGNFIEIETGSISDSDTWKIANDLLKIDGVIDTDPDIEYSEDEESINNQFRSSENSNQSNDYPPPDWYHKDIDFPQAIQTALHANNNGNGNFDGSNRIKVAQIDTGYTLHPEVRNFKINEGYNFLHSENSNDPKDRLQSSRPIPILWGGHGTSCAGVMIGEQSTLTKIDPKPDDDLILNDQVNGVFPNIDLIPFRVSRSIISFTNKMAKALDMIMEKGDIPIVSMSHASLIAKRSHRLAVQEAVNKGIIIIAAPGSHIKGFKKVFTYPAKYPETIAAAASTIQRMPWELTHGGEEVDICAPGYQILIPFPYKKRKKFLFFWKRNREYHAYKWSEGSSFSVPLTASAASLWMLHHGIENLKTRYPGSMLTDVFRSALKNSAHPFNDTVDHQIYGSGILNANELLKTKLPENLAQRSSEVRKGIEDLSRKIKNNQTAYTNDKELMHKTLMAKLKTDDQKEELRDFVMETASKSLKQAIKTPSSETIKDQVKNFIGEWYGPSF